MIKILQRMVISFCIVQVRHFQRMSMNEHVFHLVILH